MSVYKMAKSKGFNLIVFKKNLNYRNHSFQANIGIYSTIIIVLFLVGCRQNEVEQAGNETSNPVLESPYKFVKIDPNKSGVSFVNSVEETFDKFFDYFAYVYNGAGVAVGDINNDGLQDLYFTGNEVPDKLYLNKGGFVFEDITTAAGITNNEGWHNGVTMADVNADGYLDIYVCRGGWKDTDDLRANLLYINNGDQTFTESAAQFGLAETGYSNQAAFFDFDNDMDLDVYIMNRPDSFYLTLDEQVIGRLDPPEHSRDKLYLNDNGQFKEIGKKAGITGNYGFGLGVVTADLNKDGFADIFVSNDFAGVDHLYENQGDGTFKDVIMDAANHISLFSMGADIADLNNDGWEDIVVMEMRPEDYVRSKVSMPPMDVDGFYAIVDNGMHKQYMHNMLHLNQGNMFFSDVSQYAGISKTDWSWSVLAADFDNDGFKDMFVSNGYRRDVFDGDVQQRLDQFIFDNRSKYKTSQEVFSEGFDGIINSYKPVKIKNYFFHNNGKLHFDHISENWEGFDESFSNGAAIADLDNDGDLDLVVNNLEDPAFIYENVTGNANNFLRINLKGPAGNPRGIGARISVYTGGESQYYENKAVKGYLSTNEAIPHFGLGNHDTVDSIRIQWPNGKVNTLISIDVNQSIDVDYTQAKDLEIITNRQQGILFTEATKELLDIPFRHQENYFDEYEVQVLLPHMFSKTGPFLATGDINGDGMEDFYVGGASGQQGMIYLQQDGAFKKLQANAFDSDARYEDTGALFSDVDSDGDLDLYVVSGGAEYEEGHVMNQDRLYLNDGLGNFSKGNLPAIGSSGSCVTSGDFDGDGDADLFIGGQVIKDNYPASPTSYLLMNDNGTFSDVTSTMAPGLSRTGMVSSAIWANVYGNENPELVIAGEWMPLKVFTFENNQMVEISDQMGLAQTEGWWNRLLATDLDGDGDLDILAGNLGENYKFKTSPEQQFQVFAKDFDGNGTNDIFLTKHYQNNLVPVRGLQCSSQQMPLIKRKFPSFKSFANASLNQIIGRDLSNALNLKANTFTSLALINENGTFKSLPLPGEAQYSTLNAMVVKDLDGDGKKELLMAGNRFDVEVETTPADASPGYLISFDEVFNWQVSQPYETGLYLPYNVKDIKVIEVGDESILIVASNDDNLRLFRIK